MLLHRLELQVGGVEGKEGGPDVLYQLVLVHWLHLPKVEHFCRDGRGVHGNNILSALKRKLSSEENILHVIT